MSNLKRLKSKVNVYFGNSSTLVFILTIIYTPFSFCGCCFYYY